MVPPVNEKLKWLNNSYELHSQSLEEQKPQWFIIIDHYSIQRIENNMYSGTVYPDILIVYVSIESDSQIGHSKQKPANHEIVGTFRNIQH